MPKRYLYIWFPYLAADRMVNHFPELREKPFVLYALEHGRMEVRLPGRVLAQEGIFRGMAVADVRALFPSVQVFRENAEVEQKLLKQLGEWCFRYTPVVAVDPPDGVVLDISGCPHLWGGEPAYLDGLTRDLQRGGYAVHTAITDTIGASWGIAHYGKNGTIVAPHEHTKALLTLPPAALRLEERQLDKLKKLGFHRIGQLLEIPSLNLRRRLGETLIERLEQAQGTTAEFLNPVRPAAVYSMRLPCPEPILTAKGIEIALKQLLDGVVKQLARAGKGMRTGIFKAYRVDGKIVQIRIGTNRASRNPAHLYPLFELQLPQLEPAEGIELFELEALLVEELSETQEALWATNAHDESLIAELLDRIAGKIGKQHIHRYLPVEHYWPEWSVESVQSLSEQPQCRWPVDRFRPLHLFAKPRPVEVMVPLPDYPPLHFRYRGQIIRIARADGPERIEQEWWLQTGSPRDYYRVEDTGGARYWLFRRGSYDRGNPQWFLHGFFV